MPGDDAGAPSEFEAGSATGLDAESAIGLDAESAIGLDAGSGTRLDADSTVDLRSGRSVGRDDGERDPDRIFEEVAFVAYHFGWSHDTVLNMPHWERERWCAEISRINERVNEGEP